MKRHGLQRINWKLLNQVWNLLWIIPPHMAMSTSGILWLLILPFVIGCSIDKVILFNTGTYLRSFKAERHLHTLVAVVSRFLAISNVIVGLMSDLCIERIPRVMYMVVILLLSSVLYLMFLVFADSTVFLYVITSFSYTSLGVLFVMGPVLIAEYLGVTYFGIDYGSVLLVDGCFISFRRELSVMHSLRMCCKILCQNLVVHPKCKLDVSTSGWGWMECW